MTHSTRKNRSRKHQNPYSWTSPTNQGKIWKTTETSHIFLRLISSGRLLNFRLNVFESSEYIYTLEVDNGKFLKIRTTNALTETLSRLKGRCGRIQYRADYPRIYETLLHKGRCSDWQSLSARQVWSQYEEFPGNKPNLGERQHLRILQRNRNESKFQTYKRQRWHLLAYAVFVLRRKFKCMSLSPRLESP